VAKVDEVLSEFFLSCLRVAGCFVSPLLFGIVIDWALKTSMMKNAGIS